MAKKAEIKEEKKELSKEAQEELQEKYKKLFKKVVTTIQEEENIMVTYQVLADILMQLEQHISSQMGGCKDCGHECDDCKK